MSRPKKNGSKSDGDAFGEHTNQKLVSIIGQISDRMNRSGDRRSFISYALRFASQEGFDGEAVFRSFMVYIIVGSKYSALSSARKSDNPKKGDVEKAIERVAKLMSQNASRSALKKAGSDAARAASKAYVALGPSYAAKYATYYDPWYPDGPAPPPVSDAARSASYSVNAEIEDFMAGAAVAYAAKASSASHSVDAVYTDYAKGLLKIMKKEAERAKRKSNPAKRKVAKKKANPKGVRSTFAGKIIYLDTEEKEALLKVARRSGVGKPEAEKKIGKRLLKRLVDKELLKCQFAGGKYRYFLRLAGRELAEKISPKSEDFGWASNLRNVVAESGKRTAKQKGDPSKKKVAKKKAAKNNPDSSIKMGRGFNGWKLVNKSPVTLKAKPLTPGDDVHYTLVVVDPMSGEGKGRIYALYDEGGSFTGERVIRPRTDWSRQLDSATKWANRSVGLQSNPKKRAAKKNPKPVPVGGAYYIAREHRIESIDSRVGREHIYEKSDIAGGKRRRKAHAILRDGKPAKRIEVRPANVWDEREFWDPKEALEWARDKIKTSEWREKTHANKRIGISEGWVYRRTPSIVTVEKRQMGKPRRYMLVYVGFPEHQVHLDIKQPKPRYFKFPKDDKDPYPADWHQRNPKAAKKKAAKKNPGKAVRRNPQPRDLLGWEDHAPSDWTPYYQKKIGGRVWNADMDSGCDPDETDNEFAPYFAIASDGQGNRTWFGYRTGDCDYGRLLRGLEKQIRKLMGMDRGRARTMSAWREWTDHDRRRQTAELGTSTKKRANPKGAKKKVAKKKVPWSASDIKGMQEFADRKLGTKKKVAKRKPAKKKATRKTKPEWQLLINRCRKLWDHYCERPSKKRLKPVLEHLEKMKASTSKKVADERKSCLRIANKEARSLKMK